MQEPDTSKKPSVNQRHCGQLKHASWQHGYKLTRVCLYMGLHIIQLKFTVTVRMSRPNISRRFERLVSVLRLWHLGLVSIPSLQRLLSCRATPEVSISSQSWDSDISVSSPYRHSNVSCLVAPLPKSRSRLSLETLTSQSRHHTSCLQPWFWGPFRRGVRQSLNISTLAHYDYKQFIPIQWVIVCNEQTNDHVILQLCFDNYWKLSTAILSTSQILWILVQAK